MLYSPTLPSLRDEIESKHGKAAIVRRSKIPCYGEKNLLLDPVWLYSAVVINNTTCSRRFWPLSHFYVSVASSWYIYTKGSKLEPVAYQRIWTSTLLKYDPRDFSKNVIIYFKNGVSMQLQEFERHGPKLFWDYALRPHY